MFAVVCVCVCVFVCVCVCVCVSLGICVDGCEELEHVSCVGGEVQPANCRGDGEASC